MLPLLKRAFSGFLLLVTLLLGVPFTAFASSIPYSALRITTTGGGNITLAPGEVKNIAVSFQNKGSQTWKNDGNGYISLYTYGPKYRASVFDPGTWLTPSQVKRMGEEGVKPGATGTFLFSLKAPKTLGTYKETFALASENINWVTGGDFTLNITVQASSTANAPAVDPRPDDPVGRASSRQGLVPVSTVAPDASIGYSASLVTQTASKMKVLAKKTISFSAVIQNTGTKTWKNIGLSSSAMNIASGSSDFRNSTWSGNQVALLSQTVKPGATATVQFFFTSPSVNGTHTAKFQITADGISIPDSFVTIPVEVTGGSAEALDAPLESGVSNPSSVPAALITEPTIRVGVLIVDEETKDEAVITSFESDFDLIDTDGTILGSYPRGKEIRTAWDGANYLYNDGAHKKSSKPLRFVPKTPNAVMTITNFDRRLTRGTSFANNTFRNVLELRYNTPNNRTWVINELPLEYYLRGLAETSDSSPVEFQKALLTAARTYAFYHWTHSTKHRAEGFHVDAYQDQVYWGYDQEARTPRITGGVQATRGQIVTYNGDTAVTSFFSRSDGRTRNWSEVWGGNVPYAKSVPVPCDVGKTLWGHGVGMSASGALCMAKDGQDWQSILKYFYTGVDISQRW
ncbi:MAG: SpoIID/LytB domain-containing protein [Patescibacteria group bacterium]|jgi:hypothetical protein